MTDLMLTNDGERALTKGAFYWVRTATGDERKAMVPETEWQPARYTGRAADSVGETWDFIGQRSEDGHHFVDVIQVGPLLQPVF